MIRTWWVWGLVIKDHSQSRWSTINLNIWEPPFCARVTHNRCLKLQNIKHGFPRPSIVDNVENVKSIRASGAAPLTKAWIFWPLSTLTRASWLRLLGENGCKQNRGPHINGTGTEATAIDRQANWIVHAYFCYAGSHRSWWVSFQRSFTSVSVLWRLLEAVLSQRRVN